MKITNDNIARAQYVQLQQDAVISSIECKNIVIDYNAVGDIVGFEILNI